MSYRGQALKDISTAMGMSNFAFEEDYEDLYKSCKVYERLAESLDWCSKADDYLEWEEECNEELKTAQDEENSTLVKWLEGLMYLEKEEFESIMKHFDTVDELKSDRELRDMDKYEFEKVILNGKPVYACTTNQQYEDIIWGGAYETLENLYTHFGISEEPSNDMCSDIRDFILEKLKEKGIEMVDIYDEY